VKGTRAMGMGVPGVGAVKRQERDWRRSAEPEEEVEALLPCWIFFCGVELVNF
jgi:hypothetical protein